MWEWHAFVLWAAIALVAAPLIALALTPLLQRVHERVQRRQYPIVPTHL
jgi:heme exporter protein D